MSLSEIRNWFFFLVPTNFDLNLSGLFFKNNKDKQNLTTYEPLVG